MIKNLTPHIIRFTSPTGEVIEVPPSGIVARVSATYKQVGEVDGLPIFSVVYGKIEGLPPAESGVVYVASSLVAAEAWAAGRADVFAPATGHSAAVRKDGQPWAVPGLVA